MAEEKKIPKVEVPVKVSPPKIIVSGDVKVTVNPPFIVERKR